ncbi:hypothetical protein ROZALSC1DRAFT_24163 [Rozella allomycis CSF55]|uniref:Uncharacterized protein n=1 Tax=Rozella allomycis (strain CSF55) TaxID=988480 RepID=A0A4P9YE88_ROZAC|nr:hypothetical protein ROZALSC1DRAFT_24163 [Rozella allomycis CSF55]
MSKIFLLALFVIGFCNAYPAAPRLEKIWSRVKNISGCFPNCKPRKVTEKNESLESSLISHPIIYIESDTLNSGSDSLMGHCASFSRQLTSSPSELVIEGSSESVPLNNNDNVGNKQSEDTLYHPLRGSSTETEYASSIDDVYDSTLFRAQKELEPY